jgi:hypothetical protein
MKILSVISIILFLTACSADDIRCRNQGRDKGTNEYNECRDSLKSQRDVTNYQ